MEGADTTQYVVGKDQYRFGFVQRDVLVSDHHPAPYIDTKIVVGSFEHHVPGSAWMGWAMTAALLLIVVAALALSLRILKNSWRATH
jgi:hypothetical protein